MASGFFALFDDIAVLLDDVAAMSKIASKKTAGLLSDDLAVNAEKASGFSSSRELPVLWAITKGSFINKLIILPLAFLLTAFLPGIIVPILMLGGIYLAYEGAEKIYEFFFPHAAHKVNKKKVVEMSEADILLYEKKKVKSAIFVDFILSIEIIILTLSTVMNEEQSLTVQIIVVSIIAFLATVGVYGLVALIVRMDDFGYKLIRNSKDGKSVLGHGLVAALPKVIKVLTVIGTLAMLLVAGGIFLHNVHYLHELFHSLPSLLSELIIGTVVGAIALLFIKIFQGLFKKKV